MEVPIQTVCKMFGKPFDKTSVAFVSALIDEILGEPVAVINKELDHKMIEWKTYDLFTLLQPLTMESESIKLRINPEYLRITKEFVANPYLEF